MSFGRTLAAALPPPCWQPLTGGLQIMDASAAQLCEWPVGRPIRFSTLEQAKAACLLHTSCGGVYLGLYGAPIPKCPGRYELRTGIQTSTKGSSWILHRV